MGRMTFASFRPSRAVVVLLAACGQSFEIGPGDPNALSAPGPLPTTNAPGAAQAAELPCDINAILATRCQTCHSPEPHYGAPMPLVTWADLQKPGTGESATKKIYQLAQERIHSVDRPMPPGSQPRMTEQEIATFD